MKHVLFLIIFLVVIASCGTKYTGPEHDGYISYFANDNLVFEHASFQNTKAEDLHESMKDSSFYSQLADNTVFIKSHRAAIGDYLVTHLKAMKTLRLLAVTHVYDVATQKSSYYVCYYKNKNLDKKWGCKLNYSNGKYRLDFQNVNALKDKDFVAFYYKLFSPEDMKKLMP